MEYQALSSQPPLLQQQKTQTQAGVGQGTLLLELNAQTLIEAGQGKGEVPQTQEEVSPYRLYTKQKVISLLTFSAVDTNLTDRLNTLFVSY